MAVSLVATVKGTASNSYVTLAEANAYFTNRPGESATWDAETDDEVKSAALIRATGRLEQEQWQGYRSLEEQSLAWPRFETYDRDGWVYDSDLIPEPVKVATYKLAASIMAGSVTAADTGLEGFQEVVVGPLKVVPRHVQVAGELPEDVIREIAHLYETPSSANMRVYKG